MALERLPKPDGVFGENKYFFVLYATTNGLVFGYLVVLVCFGVTHASIATPAGIPRDGNWQYL